MTNRKNWYHLSQTYWCAYLWRWRRIHIFQRYESNEEIKNFLHHVKVLSWFSLMCCFERKVEREMSLCMLKYHLIILLNLSSYRCQVQYTKSYYTFDIMCVSNHDEYNLNCALDNVLESCEVRVILRNHEPLQTLAINHKCVFYSFLCIVIL